MAASIATTTQEVDSRGDAGTGIHLHVCPTCRVPLKPYARIPARMVDEIFYTPKLRELSPELVYAACPQCRSIWAADRRRNEELLSAIYAGLPPAYWTSLSGNNRSYHYWDGLLQRHARGRVLCDVGCGDGKFLQATSSRWEKHGLEPGREAVALCRAQGLDVTLGTPATATASAEFDVVTCVDTIEHTLDPQAEIDAMARMLRPDGILLIMTGQAGAWPARALGGWWEYLHCVGHISVLSRRALLDALSQADLQVAYQESSCHHAGTTLGPWLRAVARNYWRAARGYRYRRIRYYRDHQLVIARKTSPSSSNEGE